MKELKIILRGERLVAKRVIDEESTSSSGIIIPVGEKDTPNEAVVVKIGVELNMDDVKRGIRPITVGDTILIGKYDGIEYLENGEQYILVQESDIVGVIPAE